MTSLHLDRVLEPQGPACALVLTDAEVAELGGGKRAAVRVRIGEREARLRLGVMGGLNLIGMSKAARADLGVEVGQQVQAVVELDEAPREVTLPAELAAAFEVDPAARATYDALAFTHRKDFAVWVGEAKRADTRERRATEAVQMLHEGRTR